MFTLIPINHFVTALKWDNYIVIMNEDAVKGQEVIVTELILPATIHLLEGLFESLVWHFAVDLRQEGFDVL